MRYDPEKESLVLTEPIETFFFNTEQEEWPKSDLPFLLDICEFKVAQAVEQDLSGIPLGSEKTRLARMREANIQRAGSYARYIGMIVEDEISDQVAAFLEDK